jgi:hypothetical protein
MKAKDLHCRKFGAEEPSLLKLIASDTRQGRFASLTFVEASATWPSQLGAPRNRGETSALTTEEGPDLRYGLFPTCLTISVTLFSDRECSSPLNHSSFSQLM